jgi:hypothetical protein
VTVCAYPLITEFDHEYVEIDAQPCAQPDRSPAALARRPLAAG